jgi:hypothetical protein
MRHSLGPLQPVVERGAIVHLEVDLGRDVEDLAHRPPLDPLAERDAQLGSDRLAERGEQQQHHPERHEVRRQLGRLDVVLIGDQVEERAPDEQLASDRHRT